MRKLKFRAWDKFCGGMANSTIDTYYTKNGEFGFFGGDRYEIMQFTGIYDKNGKEIYEKDIVIVVYSENGQTQQEKAEVIWHDNATGYSPFNWSYECDGCECSIEIKSIEVIGNIYANPDLLK